MLSGASVGKVAFGQASAVQKEIIFVLFAQPFIIIDAPIIEFDKNGSMSHNS